MAYNNPVPDHRRKWDTIEFARKANERREEEIAKAAEKDVCVLFPLRFHDFILFVLSGTTSET
jgi:hypothetical protein